MVPRRAPHLVLTLLSFGFYGWANPLFSFLLLPLGGNRKGRVRNFVIWGRRTVCSWPASAFEERPRSTGGCRGPCGRDDVHAGPGHLGVFRAMDVQHAFRYLGNMFAPVQHLLARIDGLGDVSRLLPNN